MGSPNLNSFFDDWFGKPRPPSNAPLHPPPFAFIRLPFFRSKKPRPADRPADWPRPTHTPGKYTRMLDQFFLECDVRPDYRHFPVVDRILAEDPVFVRRDDATPEEIEENARWWEDFRKSPVVQFLKRAEDIADKVNERALESNKYHVIPEVRELWSKMPYVPGPDGRPMPRKAIKSREAAMDRFWDFTRQFFFGIWGFGHRPYPPGKPINAAQALGPKFLENRYYDFIMRSGGYFYKDRLGRTRGPMELIQLKTAWAGGIIDTHTFVWGEDMDEWAPIGMIYGMERAIATWEVRLGAAATAALCKLQKGIPLQTPLKGFEKKTYTQLQDEAIESKKRDLAVLKANKGIWPGVKIPSHALFLWASGSEMTTILEEDYMPNKFVPKDLRYRLAKVIPGLRPSDVLSIEQAMDQLTYSGRWYREPLLTFYTGPEYLNDHNKMYLRNFQSIYFESKDWNNLIKELIPGITETKGELFRNLVKRVRRRILWSRYGPPPAGPLLEKQLRKIEKENSQSLKP